MTNFLHDLKQAAGEIEGSAAENLRGVLTAGWTSSSEMYGEIGLAIRRIEGSNPDLPDSVRAVFARAIEEIHKVWPEI